MTSIQVRRPALRKARRGGGRWGRLSAIVAGAFVIGGLVGVSAPASTALAGPLPPPSLCPDANIALFGPYVCVFTPSMTQAAIQADVNAIANQQVPTTAQFNDQGYALLFEPGTYGSATTPLVFQVGYYTEVAGLGAVPQDTIINGLIEVFANGVNSDVNFWRSLSNLTLNEVTGTAPTFVPAIADAYGAGCADSEETWSASQAAPIRSVIINGSINFQDYCLGNDYASGTYVANSEINGQLNWSGNQQGIARNTDMESAAGYVWNYVYSGDECPPGYTPPAGTACSPTKDVFDGLSNSSQPGYIGGGTDGINGVDQVTELPNSPVTQEEPFLYTTSSGSHVVWDAFVPAVQKNSVGPNFLSGTEAGTKVPFSNFFVANPTTPELQIQGALNQGKDLVLTPGTYDLNAALVVSHPDSTILGLGFPVLVPQRGNETMVVQPNNGVELSGMIFDAGPVNSPVLLQVGSSPNNNGNGNGNGNGNSNNGNGNGNGNGNNGNGNNGNGNGNNGKGNDPDLIQDIFFRIGGAETTRVSATVSLLDNADNSIIDDVWAWRADHGAGPIGWTANTGDTGVTVTGDNVTAYGLAVEHYQKNEVIWSGNNGTEIFFQNELPYDPPSQTSWEASPIQPGYPSFLVSNNVQSFHSYGMGSYVVFIDTPAILWDAMAYETPNAPGVVFTDAMDLFISSTCSVNKNCWTPSQSGGLDSVIDGVGGPATDGNPTAVVDVDSYANGVATLP